MLIRQSQIQPVFKSKHLDRIFKILIVHKQPTLGHKPLSASEIKQVGLGLMLCHLGWGWGWGWVVALVFGLDLLDI